MYDGGNKMNKAGLASLTTSMEKKLKRAGSSKNKGALAEAKIWWDGYLSALVDTGALTQSQFEILYDLHLEIYEAN